MSSHPPGIPGLPMIPGLPGPSGVFGHALAQADRRRPEAEHKPLPLNIPGTMQVVILSNRVSPLSLHNQARNLK